MTNTTVPRILIIDGYTKAAREQLQSGGASLAADLYVGLLQRCAPDGIECDIIFPADPGASLPVGEAIRDYDGVAWTGCSSCVFSGEPDVAEQIEFARECYQRGVPAFGSCWAAQIAVVAAGGEVALNPNPTVQVILAAMRFALNRGDYDLCEPEEVDHLIDCLRAGVWTEEATDYAINILADAEDEVGVDATVAIGSIGAVRF